MPEQLQNPQSEPNFVLSTDLLQTADLTIRMVTEAPVDGVAYGESYSNPCIVVNFGAKLTDFQVEGDRAEGYHGSVIYRSIY